MTDGQLTILIISTIFGGWFVIVCIIAKTLKGK